MTSPNTPYMLDTDVLGHRLAGRVMLAEKTKLSDHTFYFYLRNQAPLLPEGFAFGIPGASSEKAQPYCAIVPQL